MVAKKGMLMDMGEGRSFLVDDIKKVNGQDYIVFFSMTDKAYLIGQEVIENGRPRYKILNKEESIRIATEIDNLSNK